MKSLVKEFKQFISRGNVVDMAVGVIIASAFSAIVTAMVNKVIMPVVNLVVYALTEGKGISLITVLNNQDYLIEIDGNMEVNPACIFIDWGNLIQAIINFLIIAVVLFAILKVVVKSKNVIQKAEDKAKKGILTKEQIKECKALKINITDKGAVKKYLAEKEEIAKKEKAEEEAKAKALEEEAKKNSTEYLLKEIRDLLANK